MGKSCPRGISVDRHIRDDTDAGHRKGLSWGMSDERSGLMIWKYLREDVWQKKHTAPHEPQDFPPEMVAPHLGQDE